MPIINSGADFDTISASSAIEVEQPPPGNAGGGYGYDGEDREKKKRKIGYDEAGCGDAKSASMTAATKADNLNHRRPSGPELATEDARVPRKKTKMKQNIPGFIALASRPSTVTAPAIAPKLARGVPPNTLVVPTGVDNERERFRYGSPALRGSARRLRPPAVRPRNTVREMSLVRMLNLVTRPAAQ